MLNLGFWVKERGFWLAGYMSQLKWKAEKFGCYPVELTLDFEREVVV
jgi:hypothetical protein